MRAIVTYLIVITIALLLLIPASGLDGHEGSQADIAAPDPSDGPGSLEVGSRAVPYINGLSTDSTVSEYVMVSRALMLPGGSTDAVQADFDGDGHVDLAVAVSGSKVISLFRGSADGSLHSYPSSNTSLGRTPIAIAAIDVFNDYSMKVVVLEERANDIDTERLYVFSFDSFESPLVEMLNVSVFKTAKSLVYGFFNSDDYPDVALVCPGLSPSTSPGIVDIRLGPDFATQIIFEAGFGAASITSGDYNNDSLEDLAVANSVSGSVMLFDQPFAIGEPAYRTLYVAGSPVGVSSGRLNGDSLDDLVVSTEAPNALRYYFQSAVGGIPDSEFYNRSLPFAPSHLEIGDLNGDGRDDLLVLSAAESRCGGMYQLPGAPTWPYAPDFMFPTGAYPRNAIIGQLDASPGTDIAIASARSDWSGSSLAIYPSRQPGFSNSNATIWKSTFSEPAMVETGDIDGDDYEDLVFLYPSMNAFGYMLSNTSSASFDAESVRFLGYSPKQMIVRDFNGDQVSDILIARSEASELYVYRFNASLGTFSVSSMTCLGNISSVAAGELNDDERLDIAVATDNDTVEIFFYHLDEEGFRATADQRISAVSIPEWTVVVGDFNSDGHDDLAYPSLGCKISIHLQNLSSQQFSPTPDMSLFATGSDFSKLWSGDLNGDGRSDIAAMRAGDASLYLFDQEDFTTTYTFYAVLGFPEMPKFVSVIDATDDWRSDVLAIFESADLLFLYRQENGSIPRTPSMVFVTGGRPNHANVGDATMDHRGDLITNDALSHSVSAWRQVNFPPVADAGGPYTVMQGDPLQFNGSAITGRTEHPYMEYNWSFGDGSSSGWIRDPSPVHYYFIIQTFAVSLEVRDPWGLTDGSNTTVEVIDSAPHVSFTISPENPEEGQNITLTDTTTSFDPVVNLNWFLDGAMISSGMQQVVYLQLQNGTYNVTLEATDSDGSVSSLTRILVVFPVAPEVSLISVDSALEGEDVTFVAVVDNWFGGPWDWIVSYEWDFSYEVGNFIAEENTGTVNQTAHAFAASGISEHYNVAVRVTDIDGDQSITYKPIEIFDIGPTANFSIDPESPEEGVLFRFVPTPYTWDGIVSGFWQLAGPLGLVANQHYTGAPVSMSLDNGSYTMTLTVNESDGDTDSLSRDFVVREMPPIITLQSLPIAYDYEEFSEVTLRATVWSHDPVVEYRWDFDAPGGTFQSDLSTSTNSTVHTYTQTGNYIAMVNVTDSDGSSAETHVIIRIVNKPLVGAFGTDVTITRDQAATNIITFNASLLADKNKDIAETIWSFGDGTSLSYDGAPHAPVVHEYEPVKDYVVNLTVTDDDPESHSLTIKTTLLLKAPTINLRDLPTHSVVREGTPVDFIIAQGSTPLVSVTYSVRGGEFQEFAAFYTIDTSGWQDGLYDIVVRAEDAAGNVAMSSGIKVVIDTVDPSVTFLTQVSSVYGGDKFNISISVDDANVAPGEVVLYVKLPGDSTFSSYSMYPAGDGVYYRLIDVPTREGTIEYYANVTDLAGNYQVTGIHSATVRLHFLDAAWPFLLAIAVLASLGTGAYFMRETQIAVDETFVIYNDGRLISHSTRRLKPGMDDQVLSGMFAAIQDFVRDSFKDVTSFTLRKLEFGEKSVLIEKGSYLFLAVILHGKASKKVAMKMQRIVDEIEETFADALNEWDGDLDALRGVGDIAKKLYSKAPLLPWLMNRPEN